jgi:hypothetical protein
MSYSGEVDSKSKKYEEPPQIRGLIVKICNATVIIRLGILENNVAVLSCWLLLCPSCGFRHVFCGHLSEGTAVSTVRRDVCTYAIRSNKHHLGFQIRNFTS